MLLRVCCGKVALRRAVNLEGNRTKRGGSKCCEDTRNMVSILGVCLWHRRGEHLYQVRTYGVLAPAGTWSDLGAGWI